MTATDDVGSGGITALGDGNYVVYSDSIATFDAHGEAVTLARGDVGLVGTILPANSVLVLVSTGGPGLVFDYDPALEQLVVGLPDSNFVILFSLPGDPIFTNSFE